METKPARDVWGSRTRKRTTILPHSRGVFGTVWGGLSSVPQNQSMKKGKFPEREVGCIGNMFHEKRLRRASVRKSRTVQTLSSRKKKKKGIKEERTPEGVRYSPGKLWNKESRSLDGKKKRGGPIEPKKYRHKSFC